MGRRAVAEFAATLAALAAVTLYLQLSEPTSQLRLRLAELRDELTELRIRAKVEKFVGSFNSDGGE